MEYIILQLPEKIYDFPSRSGLICRIIENSNVCFIKYFGGIFFHEKRKACLYDWPSQSGYGFYLFSDWLCIFEEGIRGERSCCPCRTDQCGDAVCAGAFQGRGTEA